MYVETIMISDALFAPLPTNSADVVEVMICDGAALTSDVTLMASLDCLTTLVHNDECKSLDHFSVTIWLKPPSQGWAGSPDIHSESF